VTLKVGWVYRIETGYREVFFIEVFSVVGVRSVGLVFMS